MATVAVVGGGEGAGARTRVRPLEHLGRDALPARGEGGEPGHHAQVGPEADGAKARVDNDSGLRAEGKVCVDGLKHGGVAGVLHVLAHAVAGVHGEEEGALGWRAGLALAARLPARRLAGELVNQAAELGRVGLLALRRTRGASGAEAGCARCGGWSGRRGGRGASALALNTSSMPPALAS